jgi:hypothetical protein
VNTATTNGSGVATSAVITANGNAGGPYSVGASAGSASTSFSLTNSQQQYQLTTQVSPAGAGTISPSSELVGGGTVVPVSATANAGYVFTGFSGALTGATNPQNLTVNGPSTVTANFSAYINVTSSVSVSSGGFTYNKVSKQGTATFTIKNTSSQTISGPVELVLSGLPAGVTAANNAGTFGGNPYWTVTTTASIAPGASAQVSVTLAYPSGTTITYTDSVYSGTL